MARVTELERLLTRISGLSGPVKDITPVSIIANSSQSNKVLIQKRIYPYFHLVTPFPSPGESMSSYFESQAKLNMTFISIFRSTFQQEASLTRSKREDLIS